MTQDEMVNLLANECGIARATARRGIDRLFTAISDSVALGDDTRLPELGVLERRMRLASSGRNPRTGEPVAIPARWHVGFRAHLALQRRLAALPIADAGRQAAE